MSIKTFATYCKHPHAMGDAPVECDVLDEAFSATLAKTAAIGILTKISQERHRILQDRNAGNTQKSLASMLFMVASMLAVAIGAINGDTDMVGKAKNGVSK